MQRQAAPGGQGNPGGGGGGKKDKGKDKIRKYGQFAWPLGLSVPQGAGGSPPWGAGGTPAGEKVTYFGEMPYYNFHRKRIPPQPFEYHREPLYFGPQRMGVDWESPFSLPRARIRQPVIQPFVIQRDEEERVEAPSWNVVGQLPMRAKHGNFSHFIGFFPEVFTELVTVDKWDNPLMRILPVIPRTPLSPWPFAPTDSPPIGEDITLDKWYQRLSEPVLSPHVLRLPQGILDPYPRPEDDLLPTRIPWWTPLSLPIFLVPHPVPGPYESLQRDAYTETLKVAAFESPLSMPVWPLLRPPPGDFSDVSGLSKDETPFVFRSAYSTTMALPPWRPKMPIALFPFRVEVESEDPEPITLDKWYSSTMAYPALHTALRAVTGPEGQTKWWTVVTAPWIEFGRVDPLPIPDIPGVTYAYWFTSMSLPRELFTAIKENDPNHLRLYYPLQVFPIFPVIEPCESPRRRVSNKTGSCGV
jgi:hypothetical protein